MGVIQGSINQLLTTAGVAARLNPVWEERAKTLGKIKSEEKKLKAIEEAELGGTPQEIANKKAALAEEKASVAPTEKNIEAAFDLNAEAVFQDIRVEQRAKQALLKKQREKERSENFRKITEGVPEIQWQQLKTMQK